MVLTYHARVFIISCLVTAGFIAFGRRTEPRHLLCRSRKLRAAAEVLRWCCLLNAACSGGS